MVSVAGIISWRRGSCQCGVRGCGNIGTHLKASASSHILLALPGRLRLRPIELAPFLEELWLCACARARKPLWHLSHNLFHHGQMLEIVMCLEESDAGVELDEDAAEGEDVTGIGPAQT